MPPGRKQDKHSHTHTHRYYITIAWSKPQNGNRSTLGPIQAQLESCLLNIQTNRLGNDCSIAKQELCARCPGTVPALSASQRHSNARPQWASRLRIVASPAASIQSRDRSTMICTKTPSSSTLRRAIPVNDSVSIMEICCFIDLHWPMRKRPSRICLSWAALRSPR